MSEWISVIDKLPSEAGVVLVYVDYKDLSYNIFIADFYTRGNVFCKCPDAKYITHWMPLPEPPNKS